MGGGSGGGGKSGRGRGGGDLGGLTAAQIGTAQGKVAGIVESALTSKWAGKNLNSYQANSLNFLADQSGRKSPLSEKQATWLGKLARDAAQGNDALSKSYLSEKVLKKIGL